MKRNDPPIIVEETYKAKIEEVWDSITDVNKMRLWYFENLPSFKAEVGFETKFDVQNESRTFPHLWKVTEVVPGKKLTYNWKFEGYAGDSFVVFELFEEGIKTKLRLTVNILEDFPENVPEFKRESCISGWTYFINKRLKEYLEKE